MSSFRSLFPHTFWLHTWLSWSGIEEVGCQVSEQFYGRENCWGLISLGAKMQLQCSETSGPPVVEALEGKWGSQGTVEQRRGTLPWVGQACGE
jgi:hypothetical protein